jgi:hypothetical protein
MRSEPPVDGHADRWPGSNGAGRGLEVDGPEGALGPALGGAAAGLLRAVRRGCGVEVSLRGRLHEGLVDLRLGKGVMSVGVLGEGYGSCWGCWAPAWSLGDGVLVRLACYTRVQS